VLTKCNKEYFHYRSKTVKRFTAPICLLCRAEARYSLGDEVFLLLTIMELEERLPIPGKVVWVTPAGAQGNRRPGIGVQFADTSDGAHARTIIESHLAQLLSSDKRTHTM